MALANRIILLVAVLYALYMTAAQAQFNDVINEAQCELSGLLNCENCVEKSGCYFCEKTNLCYAFHGDGVDSFFPDTDRCELNETKWLQCTLDYQALIIIAAVALVLILASFVCCCYCCCCR